MIQDWEKQRAAVMARLGAQMEARRRYTQRMEDESRQRYEEDKFNRAAGAPLSGALSGAMIGSSFAPGTGTAVGAGIGYGLGAIGEYSARRKRGEGGWKAALGALNPFDETAEAIPGIATDPRTMATASAIKNAPPRDEAAPPPPLSLGDVTPGAQDRMNELAVHDQFQFDQPDMPNPPTGGPPEKMDLADPYLPYKWRR